MPLSTIFNSEKEYMILIKGKYRLKQNEMLVIKHVVSLCKD
jgi:hypothetical protein